MATGRLPDPNSAPVTAKGDLYTYSTVPAKLAVGNNGETLVADSSATTGLRWQGSISAGKNIAINGNFDIWQRGTTFNSTADSAYNADRWQTAINYSGGTTNVTRDTSVPNAESQYSLKVTHATANTTTISEYSQRQRVEAENVLPLLGKTVTLSFWYRSNKTGNHGYRLYPVSVTGASDTQGTFSVTAANTWEKKTITTSALFGSATAYTGSANAQALWIVLGFQTNGSGQSSVASGDYFQIAQVQLESGSVATNFMRSGGNIAGEFQACQRYYWRTSATANAYATLVGGMGMAYATGTVMLHVQHPVPMRTTPSSTIDSGGTPAAYNGVDVVTGITFTYNTGTPLASGIILNKAASFTQYRPYGLVAWNDTSTYFGLSAEL